MDLRQREHIETVVGRRHAAWRCGPRPRTMLSSTIRRRCVHQYGLDPSRMQEARILPQARLREHQQRPDDFVRIARHGLQTLYGRWPAWATWCC